MRFSASWVREKGVGNDGSLRAKMPYSIEVRRRVANEQDEAIDTGDGGDVNVPTSEWRPGDGDYRVSTNGTEFLFGSFCVTTYDLHYKMWLVPLCG